MFVTGSTHYSPDSGSYFADSYKKLLKTQAGKNKSKIEELIEEIVKNPFGHDCKEEPRPNKMKLPEDWRFFKLRRKIAPHASGQIRVMYLVSERNKIIQFLIYTHEQYEKRPHDAEIINAVKELIGD
jgi:mRNA-degrading endonuclease RelE of RelBE toxin-antitoxin system